MRNVRKFTIFLSLFLLITAVTVSLPASAAFTPTFEVYSSAVYMVNTDTDIVIMSKNADEKRYPASTTKIMTCILALESVDDMGAPADVPAEAFAQFASGNPNFYGASGAWIEPQQSLTYRDLINSLMVSSACESANILAVDIAGDIPAFVDMMNAKAQEIGCTGTHFSNPHGLFDEDNYTTAHDLYLITKYAIDTFPEFMDICGAVSYDMPPNDAYPDGYTKYTTNQLMIPQSDYYYEGVRGIKTGSIDYYFYPDADGNYAPDNLIYEYGSRSLVTAAQRDGYSYILVTLDASYFGEDGSETETQLSFTDHINLYDWAFGQFSYTKIVDKATQLTHIDVDNGQDTDKVGVVAAEDYYTLLPCTLDTSTIQQVRDVQALLEAPVSAGQNVGTMELMLDGETLAKIPLVAEGSVELNETALYTERFHEIASSPQFAAICAVIAVLIVLALVSIALRRRRKKRSATKKRHN